MSSEGERKKRKPKLKAMLAYADKKLNWQRWQSIDQEFADNRPSERKFLDAREWLKRAWLDAVAVGLVERESLRILDLGTGAGYFPFVCRYLGHEVVALDRPGTRLYDELCNWIGVRPIPHRIEPFQRFPSFGQRFHLVTAFRIEFNTRSDGTLYDLPEWEFFLDDVRDNLLLEGGGLCLKMNRETKRIGRAQDDPELMHLFAERGGCLLPNSYIIFSPLS